MVAQERQPGQPWNCGCFGWSMAAEVALGAPILVPIIVFTGLGP